MHHFKAYIDQSVRWERHVFYAKVEPKSFLPQDANSVLGNKFVKQ